MRIVPDSGSISFATFNPPGKMCSARAQLQDYFERMPEDRREALGTLRGLIKRTWPDSDEDFAYGMPTYHLDGKPVFGLADQKHFMALHVIPYDLLSAFKNELRTMDCGKSCIRFRQLDEATFALLDRVVKYVGSQRHLSRITARPMGQRKTPLSA